MLAQRFYASCAVCNPKEGTRRSPMEPYGILWNPMEPNGALWNLTEPYDTPWDPTEPC